MNPLDDTRTMNSKVCSHRLAQRELVRWLRARGHGAQMNRTRSEERILFRKSIPLKIAGCGARMRFAASLGDLRKAG